MGQQFFEQFNIKKNALKITDKFAKQRFSIYSFEITRN